MLVLLFPCRGEAELVATYSHCGENILELVHESNQARVVHVDAVDLLAIRNARGCLGTCAYAFGFVAMVGEVVVEVVSICKAYM